MIEKKIVYQGYDVFTFEEEYIELGKKILNNDYEVVASLKDTKRNYVIIIEVEGKKYVLKEPRNEFRIPQRKFMSALKKGEALTTLENINILIEKGFREFVKPLVAINKRENGMIVYSALIMEYYDGVIDIKNNDKLVDLVKKMHEFRVYHGDFNPGNFLSKGNEIKIIDTQAKKMFFGRYRAHYDMITMKYDSYNEMKYPYRKDIWYYLAFFMKKLKRLKVVEAIKKKKKELRDRGWKI